MNSLNWSEIPTYPNPQKIITIYAQTLTNYTGRDLCYPMGLISPLIPWRTTKGTDFHSVFREFHLKKHILGWNYTERKTPQKNQVPASHENYKGWQLLIILNRYENRKHQSHNFAKFRSPWGQIKKFNTFHVSGCILNQLLVWPSPMFPVTPEMFFDLLLHHRHVFQGEFSCLLISQIFA